MTRRGADETRHRGAARALSRRPPRHGAHSPAVGAGPALGTEPHRNDQNKCNTGLRLHRVPRTPLRHARGLCQLCRQPRAPASSPETEPSLGQRAALTQGTHGRPGCWRAEGRLCRCALREPLPDIAYYGPGFHDHESGRSERLSSESPAELRPVTGCSARVFNRVGPKRSGS
ncbi:hypothetical protein PAL_GLEAN10022957 [Pteropus alecto]|uniref:Uncharacterized protein n=1 Tax=Pteropus alecto TaxID=9402 RepID=L5K5G2_PTEAL|nr:hypothetical protein PAL_GLEAN10022957 [Pteropus alecto]